MTTDAQSFWFVLTSSWPGIESRLTTRSAAPAPGAQPVARRPAVDLWGDAIEQTRMVGKVAVIPIKGVLLKGATGSEKQIGFTSYEDVHEDLDTATANKAGAILLDISSPGGSAVGAGELGRRIADLARSTPVYSFTDSMQCSAAEYLSAGCIARFATADAIVGSIGTIMETVSFEGMLKKAGIAATVFTSGKYKGAGHPLKDLSKDQADYLQGFVDTLAGEFKAHMTRHRGLKADLMQGQVFTGRQGAANGLIDGNVPSLAAVLALLK